MALPFTNTHTHIFNSECAPDRFLLILPMRIIRRVPKITKKLIDSKFGRFVIQTLYNISSKKNSNSRKEFDKYIAFLDVGTSNSQRTIFEMTLKVGQLYDSAARIVGLTLNMDYMDNISTPKKRIGTQLEEVKEIKRFFPANFFPFLGVDPRHKSGMELVNWARHYFETGVTDNSTGVTYPFFCGIKIYPALGFFPFDPRLHELYLYAQEKQIPVMTHCTRVGSQYIGEEIESLIPPKPAMILSPGNANALAAQRSIETRIALFRANGWVKNSKRGENDRACDLFGHPENYITLLESYPNLKLCLAHMGGSDEILDPPSGSTLNRGERELAEIRKVDLPSWFERIREMMKAYPNLYTDISYTLSDFNNSDNTTVIDRVKAFFRDSDRNGRPLSERVLFGTDFFMTEREMPESELYADAKPGIEEWWDRFSRENPRKFIGA